jgi:hypothetical protein
MIYIVFCDRLGNNLFQFAAALSLSSELTICVPIKEEYEATLKHKDTFFKGFSIINYIPKDVKIYEEPSHQYNQIPFISHENIILKGYFQSHKYINRSKILNQFSIDIGTHDFIKNKYPQILIKEFTSIHVRRGDYLKMLYKHPFSGLEYYKKAIKLIGEEKNFIFVSDDIVWCKRNFKLKNVIFVENTSPIIDLYIQSYCKNNIISNSSFSWWGAYLNNHKNKNVIAPSMWFGFKFKVNTKDLLPNSYIIINNNHNLFFRIKSWYQLIRNKIKNAY